MVARTAPALSVRRLACSALVLLAMVASLFCAAPARAADPAVEFMKQVSRDLIAASRGRSMSAFQSVILRYGDITSIGLYSLGSYRARLAETDKQNYLSGLTRFLARYAATEAPKYPVSHAEILGPSKREWTGILVDTRVHLRDGTTYDVRWLLSRYGNSFRIRDAQVLGFWMTPMLKKLFEDYINENGGNPRALVVALNR